MICNECETVAHCLKNGCVPKQPSKDEALKLALEALGKARSRIVEAGGSGWKLEAQRCVNAITAIKQALFTATQEPVAWVEPEFWSYLEQSNCGTAYRLPDGERQPLYTTPPAAQPALKPLTPDMFWNQDDAETPHDSIEEFLNSEICNGYLEVGAVFTLLQAKKFPSVKIRVTSIDENECEAEYEIIEAAHGNKGDA